MMGTWSDVEGNQFLETWRVLIKLISAGFLLRLDFITKCTDRHWEEDQELDYSLVQAKYLCHHVTLEISLIIHNTNGFFGF